MRLVVDRQLQKIVLGPGTNQPIGPIEMKRSSNAEIEIQFLDGITPVELSSDASGIFEVKPVGDYDVEPLAAALAWVKTGTGTDTLYTFNLGLINAVLDRLLGINDPVTFTVTAATDLINSVAHGLVAGNVVQFASDGTLPAGMSANTDYFVLASGLTANAYKVSLTDGGATIDITDTGTGTHQWTRLDNDIVSVTLMAELQWVADGKKNKSQTLSFILVNDVARDGDVPPSSPALMYGLFLPEISSLADFKAIPTVGRTLGSLVQILIDVSGTRTWLTYRLVTGPTIDPEPADVEPNDYDSGTNDVHWEGAAGPSGPAGVSAGIPFKWNTNAATTDPTAGKVKVNNATLASATELYISETDDDGNALGALFATWDDGTSIVRGRLLISDPATPANFAIFDITGTRTDNGAWDTFTITPVTSGGTLTNNLPVRLSFYSKGDKGDQGDAGIKYQFNSALAADPGSGKFLFNNATFLSATELLISETDGNANALSGLLATLDDSTSSNKCLIIAQKTGGAALFAFYITAALTDNGDYDTFPITPIATSGVIADGDTFYLTFARVGNIGTTGATGATGRELALQYLFNTSTSNANPGAGKLALNNATLASATALYINETDNDTNVLSALLATWDDSTSTIKGRLFIHSPGTPTIFAFYDITGTITDNGAWDTFTIAHVASGGTFTDDMPITAVFIPAGNVGATGAAGPTGLPQNAQNAAYTLVIGDAGKHIFHDEVTARVYTIPANASVAFAVGDTVTIVNNNGAGAITLSITSDTLRRGDGTAGTGSRTIPADAIATILKTKTTEWLITGVFT